MEKIVYVSVMIVIIILSGCTSSLTPSEEIALCSIYDINKETIEDVNGDLTLYRLLLYKDLSLETTEVFTLDKYVTTHSTLYSLSVETIGPDWPSIEEIGIKINDNYYNLEVDKTTRIVKDYATIIQIITVMLTDYQVDELSN